MAIRCDPNLLQDYDAFVTELLAATSGSEETDDLQNQLLESKQGHKNPKEYVKGFQALQLRLQASEEEVCYYFKRGLNLELKLFLAIMTSLLNSNLTSRMSTNGSVAGWPS